MTIYFDKGRGKTMPLTELQLGDTVELFDGPYGTGIVCEITDKDVWFYRPYGTNAGFSCTSPHGGIGVICYTGLETFSRPRNEREMVKVWQRDDNIR